MKTTKSLSQNVHIARRVALLNIIIKINKLINYFNSCDMISSNQANILLLIKWDIIVFFFAFVKCYLKYRYLSYTVMLIIRF